MENTGGTVYGKYIVKEDTFFNFRGDVVTEESY